MSDWIQLRRGRPRGEDLILEEFQTAYQIFDTSASVPPLVLAIGNEEKRQFLKQACNAPIKPTGGITLRQLPWAILADCDLHNHSELLPLEPNPLAQRIRHPIHYVPQYIRQSLPQLPYYIYWQLLAPLSCVIILFARDFSDPDTLVGILSTWIRSSMTQTMEAPPRIVIVCDEVKSAQATLNLRLKTAVREALRSLQPSRTDHSSSLNSYCRKAFESIQLMPELDNRALGLHIHDLFSLRGIQDLNFSALHLKSLLGQAVQELNRSSESLFNVYDASRVRNPVPRDLAHHIVHCFEASKNSNLDAVSLVASALEFNAYPPGMHYFQPRRVFDRFYRAAICHAAQLLSFGDLPGQVHMRFIEIALQRKGASSARAHLRLLKHQDEWEHCHSEKTCLVCMAQRPSFVLSCMHRLCKPCATICARWSPRPGILSRCPLCGIRNERRIRLIPPTAGLRMLEISGNAQSKFTMMKFLTDLEHHIGMKGYALGQHFDLLAGSDIGTYLAHV
ncbi:hypothetical protein GE09DRAFT_974861, partial [Coniochaeta sp. 2T2.1]